MISPQEIASTVARALAEDVGSGDLSAALISAETQVCARVFSRQPTIIAGRPWFDEVFRQLDANVVVEWQAQEGQAVAAGKTLCHLRGPARALLTGERTALNFLQMLSATATKARCYVEAVKGTGAVILDTRKTVPGLRAAQKYAVTCGAASNHRMGLFDVILIKENHIAAAGSLTHVVRTARQQHPDINIEVEVEGVAQFEEALAAGADMILLDNFALADLKVAVEINNHRARLEASGGVTLRNVRAIAETGVDYISVGALTKDIHAIDLSMRIMVE
ncbi:MAG: carboxylating nicotinate-nucleotide diphosphorylase [Pseudomonadota bacterium]|nr:carboxylating nicotinate-nucleotide diphosphorylase [Pseudomonadota bacterium]